MKIYCESFICIEGFICMISIFMNLLQSMFYKKLVRDSMNIKDSRNKVICNLKKTFDKEYARMKKINNVNVFIQKNMYDVKLMGIRSSTWNTIGIINILLCAGLGIVAAILTYFNMYDEQDIIMHILIGFIMGFLIILSDLIFSVQHKSDYLCINICEYFENTYIPMLEAQNNVTAFLPYESKDIDEGIQELFRLMSEESNEAHEYIGLLDAEHVVGDIEIDEKEEKILKDVFEEYLV